MVTAFATAHEKAVKDKISQHRKEFEAKPDEERTRLSKDAELHTKSFPFEPELPATETPRNGGLSQAFLSDVFDSVIEQAFG